MNAARVYAFYDALYATERGQAGQLGGTLLLYENLDEEGCIAALAANIAGVATLGIDGNNAVLKQALRDGVCDFLVNHLDEALRILKNEIRKKQPVSVCLEQELSSALSEIVNRGVQPDYLALKMESSADARHIDLLRARGAVDVVSANVPGQPSANLQSEWMGMSWTARKAPALWLPKVDAIAVGIVDRSDNKRQRWLQFAPRYLGRLTAGTHFLPMSAEEAKEFCRIIEEKVADRSIGSALRIVMNAPDGQVLEISSAT